MNQWPLQFYVPEHSGDAEVSAEFLLRLVPIRPGEDDPRFIDLAMRHEGEEVELEIEVAACGEEVVPCGEIVSLHFHGTCYES